MSQNSANSAAVDRENPWLGLASFTEEAHGFFFGRERETDELQRLVGRQTLTVLFGQSGLGKSSLLQAGLFPLLRAADYLPLYLRLDHGLNAQRSTFNPQRSPAEPDHLSVQPSALNVERSDAPASASPIVEQVKAALAAAFAAAKADAPAFRADETLWEYFHRKDVDIWSAKNRLLTPVLVFDQFEEIFTLGRVDETSRARSQAFLTELACLVENRPPPAVQERLDRGELDPARFNHDKPSCRVILSLREDFLPDLEGLRRDMPALIHNRLRLKKLSGTQALDIVTKPAPHLLAEGVAERIVEFVAGARGGSAERLAELDVEPPLLSVICRELNDRRRTLGQTQITADLVSGNRREILHDFYERSVADLPAAMRAFVEDRLLTKSGFRDNLALETALEEPGVTRPLIDTLVSRRLLRVEDRLGVQRVELTHDVLADVIRASRDARQQRLAVEAARAREAEALAAAARRTRRLRWIVAGLAAIVVALCAVGLFGLHARRLALQSASRTDASFASRLLEQGNAAEGFAYFVRAVRKDPHNSAIVPRLLSALVTRNFILPEGAPLELPAATRNVRYSLDGTRVWVVGADSAIRLVSTSDRRVMNEFKFDQPIRAVVFPEKNDRVFAVRFADASRRMFDSATGQPLTPPMREERLLNFTLLSPDGRRLATASDTRIFIYDATTGRRRTVIDYARNRFVSNWSFSPDGQRLITSALGGFIRQWSTADGAPLGEEISIPGVLAGQAPFVDYRPDGKAFVVCAQSAGGQLFETATGRKVGPVMPHELCQSAQFTADGERLFTFGLDGGVTTVRTWDAATGKSLLPPWPVVGTFDFSFSHDGNVLFTSNRQGVAHVWDTRKGKPLAEPTPAVGRLARTSGSPDGTTVVMAADTKLYFFRIGAGAARPLDLRRTPPFMKAPFLAGTSARLLWFGKDRASVLDVASGREVSGGFSYPRSFTGLSTGGSDVRADAGAMAVLTGEPTTLKPDSHWEGWSLDAGGASHAVVLEDAPVGSPPGSNWLCFSPRGDLVALTANTSAQTIRVWSLITGKPLAPPIAMDSRLALTNSRPAAFSPDGTRLAVGAVSGAARVWDVATGRGVFDLEPAAPSYIRFVSFSPDGERIATGSASGLVRLWDAKTGQLIREPIVLDASLGALEFSKDGRLLLTSTPDNTRLWDGRTAEPIGEPFAAGEVTRGAQFNDDGSRLATAHNTNGATIWDTATQQPITEPLAHPGVRVVSAELSPDGRFLRTETSDNHFYVWPVPPAAGNVPVPGWLADLATICIGQRLTDAGQLESATDALARIDDVRRTLASLPDDAPYVEWGRWFLANRATRSIAPGFTITPAEAETLAKSISGQ